ncbi:hypothetical protein DPMN_098731 [Dreissena polymorpha]|uniref:Uncharacterized protein n=1 Tax=Dreissena polymorpha TaxID=45954 RepID=A0A9D4LFS6_DREPO|nr:hypothetical protein DPMN_098731 [Dreissena polymorpha]
MSTRFYITRGRYASARHAKGVTHGSLDFARPCNLRIGLRSISISGGDAYKQGPLIDRGRQKSSTRVTITTRVTAHAQNAFRHILSLIFICDPALMASGWWPVLKGDKNFIASGHGPDGAGTIAAPQKGSKPGPNTEQPFTNCRVSPIGLVPKKTTGK